ncbi:MAG: DUF927 domain-containing protein [Streptosporangiaceae bacterium]
MPGSAGWAYRPGAGIWRLTAGADDWARVLAWCPLVADAVRYVSQDGRTITRAFKVTVASQTEVVTADDLTHGKAWPRFATAAGFTGRPISDVLVNIVTDQASRITDVIGYPYFADGQLHLPPTEYLPDGYCNGEGSDLASLTELVSAVAQYPSAALLMGLSASAPLVGALQLQPFTIHIVGDSTTGKTTAVTAAGTLWGRSYKGVTKIWHGTANGALGGFRDLGVLPVFRDELGTLKATPAERATMFSTIMEGAYRSARTRDDLARPSASWASVCFSTGNVSAVPPAVASAGTPKGVIELHADGRNPIIPADAKACVQALSNVPAVAGAWVPYAKRLTVEAWGAAVDLAGKTLGDPAADGLEWHMWRAMSLALAGAWTLAELTGVRDLAVNAELAAREVIAATADRLAEIGADQGARLAETVTEMIDAHPAAFGLDPELSPRIEQVGFVTHAQDGAELTCLYPNRHADVARRAEVEDATTALRQLRDSGQLRTTKGKGLRYAAWRNNRTVHVYAYDLRTETGGNEGKGGKSPGRSAGEHYPPGGNEGPGQGVMSPGPAAAASWGPGTVGAQIHGEPLPEPPPDYDPGPGPEPGPASSAALTMRLSGKVVPAVRCPGCQDLGPASIAVGGYHVTCVPDPAPPEAPPADPLPGMDPAASTGARTTETIGLPEPSDSAPGPAEPARRPVADLSPADELDVFARSVRKPELYPEAADEDVSAALAIFHEVTDGGRYVSFAGQTGQALFARQLARFPSMVAPVPVESARAREAWESGAQTRANFVTRGLKVKPGVAFTGFDINGQFPAAAGSTELGDGEPEVIEYPRALGDLINLPGYVRVARANRTGHPAFGTLAADSCLPMPFVKFLTRDLGLTIPAAEVIYWPRKGKRLAVYVKYAYREPRERLVAMPDTMPVRLAWAALKDQANAFIGMLRSEKYSKGGFYQPAWYDMIVSTAEANALRAIRKVTVQPVAKIADTAYWVAEDAPRTPEGLIVSSQLGKWKPERWGPVTAEFADAYRAKDVTPRTLHDIAKRIDAERRAQCNSGA